MALLIFFVVVWVLFALWAFRCKLGGIVAVAGGFFVGCLSLVPIIVGGKYLDEKYGPKADQVVQQVTAAPFDQVIQAKGLGVGYDHLIAAINPYTPDLKPAPTTNGSTRLLGRTGGGTAGILEVSGKALYESVEKATLSVVISNDDTMNGANSQLLGRFLAVIFPDWTAREDWAVKAIQGGEKVSVQREGKRLTFIPVSEMQMLMFTAEGS